MKPKSDSFRRAIKLVKLYPDWKKRYELSMQGEKAMISL